MLESISCWGRSSVAVVLLVLMLASSLRADEGASGPPIGPEDAKSKVGEFLVKFTDKSPDSVIAKIEKRMGLKSSQPVEDYDLSKEVFDVYVPKEPGADGKFGLVVSMSYPGHQWPPATFKPVLEQYHLIWIGVMVATDSRPTEQHAGLLLDADYNVSKIWSIDPRRNYLGSWNVEGPIGGMAFYYSDTFTGTIIAPGLSWFYKIKDPRPTVGTWNTDELPRPQSADWDRAKNKSRFFLTLRDEQNANAKQVDDLILRLGFGSSGFKHVKSVRVPNADQDRWIDWKSGWFEQAIEFLDESAAGPASQPTASDKVRTGTAKTPASAADTAAKVAGALELAQNYISLGKYDLARARLNQIITRYPNTPSAAKAKQLLKDIDGK
jgi:hypothetical protein